LKDHQGISEHFKQEGAALQTLLWLVDEIPYVMAPASIIAAITVITLITNGIRITQKASRVMMIGVMIALTVGVVIIQTVQ